MSTTTTLTLEPRERLLWSGHRRGSRGVGTMQLYAAAVYGAPFALGAIIAGLVALEMVLPGSAAVVVAVIALALAALAVQWWRSRQRPAFHLTSGRLIERGLFGGRTLDLRNVQVARRMIREVRTRYGLERIETDLIELSYTNGMRISFGPTTELDRACELINLVAGGFADVRVLPALAGEPSPAEQREDFLVAGTHVCDGMTYGPLFVGPRTILRFTESLPVRVEARLFQSLAAAPDADAAEAQALAHASDPGAGYVQQIKRADAHLAFIDGALVVTRPEGSDRLELAASDRARTARFVASTQRAPMRG